MHDLDCLKAYPCQQLTEAQSEYIKGKDCVPCERLEEIIQGDKQRMPEKCIITLDSFCLVTSCCCSDTGSGIIAIYIFTRGAIGGYKRGKPDYKASRPDRWFIVSTIELFVKSNYKRHHEQQLPIHKFRLGPSQYGTLFDCEMMVSRLSS